MLLQVLYFEFPAQALWAFVVLLPVTVALASPVTAQLRLSGWHVVSAGAFLVGFLCEAVADYQKFVFKSDPQNKGVCAWVGGWDVLVLGC